MNTHNVNVNTATPESPKTWVKSPSFLWLGRRDGLLITLAKAEGDLMTYLALSRAGVSRLDDEALSISVTAAADAVRDLEDMGAVSAADVYQMIYSAEALSLAAFPEFWLETHPEPLPALEDYCRVSQENRTRYIARMAER
ncbi:hypothetical protein [Pantoea sp. GbtcB22]|uniref:hypothetical protein n=1 Tax=Pantoea sp. GbtcB22 TaxID=2824767 RepID=UPI001C30964D|nr:hypothetical protein [Pantoea sp. GbtcB22]